MSADLPLSGVLDDQALRFWQLKTLDTQMETAGLRCENRYDAVVPESRLRYMRPEAPLFPTAPKVGWALAGRVAWLDILTPDSAQIAVVEALVEKSWSQMDWQRVPDSLQQPMWVAAVLMADQRQHRFSEGTVMDRLVHHTLEGCLYDHQRDARIVKLLATAPIMAYLSVLGSGYSFEKARERWQVFPQEALLRLMFSPNERRFSALPLQEQLIRRHARNEEERSRWSDAVWQEGLKGWEGCMGTFPTPSSEPWFDGKLSDLIVSRFPDMPTQPLPLGVVKTLEALLVDGCEKYAKHGASLNRRGIPFASSVMGRALFLSQAPTSSGFEQWLMEASPAQTAAMNKHAMLTPLFKARWLERNWTQTPSSERRPRL